jgi:hypothetical protein
MLAEILSQPAERINLDTLVRIVVALGVPLELKYGYREPLANGAAIKPRSMLPNMKDELWARELHRLHNRGIALMVSADADLAHRVLLSIFDDLTDESVPGIVEHLVSHIALRAPQTSIHATEFGTLAPALDASLRVFDRIMCGAPQYDGDLAAITRLALAGVPVAFPYAGSDITSAIEDLVMQGERDKAHEVADRLSLVYFVRLEGKRVIADTLSVNATIRCLIRNGEYSKVEDHVHLAIADVA